MSQFTTLLVGLFVALSINVNHAGVSGQQTDGPPLVTDVTGGPGPADLPILLPQCDCWNYATGSRCDNEAFWNV